MILYIQYYPVSVFICISLLVSFRCTWFHLQTSEMMLFVTIAIANVVFYWSILLQVVPPCSRWFYEVLACSRWFQLVLHFSMCAPHLENLFTSHTPKIFIWVFLHSWLFPVNFSSMIFIVVPSITKLICSFTCVLFVLLFAGHKIDKTLIVTFQTMVNLKIVFCHSAAKHSSISYITANFTSSFITFPGTYLSLQWI